jgi:hypothetical protein
LFSSYTSSLHAAHTMDPEPEAELNEPVRFRPSKKRKTYRHRDADQDDDGQSRSEEPSQRKQPQPAAPATATATPAEADRSAPLERAVASDFFGGGAGARNKATGDNDDQEAADDTTSPPPNGKPAGSDDQPASVAAAAIRLRNARKARARAGVNFGTHTSSTTRLDPDDTALALRDPETASLSSMADRFTQQTGLIRHLDDRHMYVPSSHFILALSPPEGGYTNSRTSLISKGTNT